MFPVVERMFPVGEFVYHGRERKFFDGNLEMLLNLQVFVPKSSYLCS